MTSERAPTRRVPHPRTAAPHGRRSSIGLCAVTHGVRRTSAQLACSAGDTACRNTCTAAAAGDSQAISAAANLVLCATRVCDVCPRTNAASGGASGIGGAGSGSGGRPPTATGGNGAAPNGGSNPATGGAPGRPAICQTLLEWATGCALDREPELNACDATPLAQCHAGCYVVATCNDYDDQKSGAENELSVCLDACNLANGGDPTPSCANSAAKAFLCDVGARGACDDGAALDGCINRCWSDFDCTAIRGAFIENQENEFVACYDACEADPGEPNPSFIVDEGGYVTAGPWDGYAWTDSSGDAGTTIAPADFSAVPAGGQLCVSGTVGGSADFSSFAMLGLTLMQERGEPGEPAPEPTHWNSRGQGVRYNITNRAGTPLRIQIQGLDGDTDPTQRWCADVSAQASDIFWHTFNTECWEGGAGTEYLGSSLESVSVLVPGDQVPVAFDFCVYELGPDL